jgi:hypothetical protein
MRAEVDRVDGVGQAEHMAKPYWVDKAIDEAAFILERIGKRWPVGG